MARRWLVILTLCCILLSVSGKRKRYRKPIKQYPQGTLFWATDFFVRGCKNFLEKCPKAYKNQHICAQNYDGKYKNFNNYCEMQYENCNTWRNWIVFKREKC